MFALLLALASLSSQEAPAASRVWTDTTGHYSIEGDLIARNASSVVIQKKDKSLVAVPISTLSEADRKHLAELSGEAGEDAEPTWKLRDGMEVRGDVVDYARREVTVQRRRGKVYVNDKLFSNLPDVYRRMLPKVINHFEGTELNDEKDLNAWATKLRGEAKTYTVEGVLLELPNGDLYGVPFFFFDEATLKALQPGWNRWLEAAENQEAQEQESLMLQAQSEAYARDREEMRQIARLQLQLQAYDAGLFDLWEVGLLPAVGNLPPLVVVMPGRTSEDAAAAALSQYPGYRVGGIGRVRRRR